MVVQTVVRTEICSVGMRVVGWEQQMAGDWGEKSVDVWVVRSDSCSMDVS